MSPQAPALAHVMSHVVVDPQVMSRQALSPEQLTVQDQPAAQLKFPQPAALVH
jgi:hypothetical protein